MEKGTQEKLLLHLPVTPSRVPVPSQLLATFVICNSQPSKIDGTKKQKLTQSNASHLCCCQF